MVHIIWTPYYMGIFERNEMPEKQLRQEKIKIQDESSKFHWRVLTAVQRFS